MFITCSLCFLATRKTDWTLPHFSFLCDQGDCVKCPLVWNCRCKNLRCFLLRVFMSRQQQDHSSFSSLSLPGNLWKLLTLNFCLYMLRRSTSILLPLKMIWKCVHKSLLYPATVLRHIGSIPQLTSRSLKKLHILVSLVIVIPSIQVLFVCTVSMVDWRYN